MNKRNFSEISCDSETRVDCNKKQKSHRTSEDSALFSTDHDQNLCRLQASSEDDFIDVESFPTDAQNNQIQNSGVSCKTISSSSGHSSPRSTTRSSESVDIDVEEVQDQNVSIEEFQNTVLFTPYLA